MYYEKKVIVNNSSNIDQTTNHLSPQIIEIKSCYMEFFSLLFVVTFGKSLTIWYWCS